MPQRVLDLMEDAFKRLKNPDDHACLAALVIRNLIQHHNLVLETMYEDKNLSRKEVMGVAAPWMRDLSRLEAANDLITATLDMGDDCCSEDE